MLFMECYRITTVTICINTQYSHLLPILPADTSCFLADGFCARCVCVPAGRGCGRDAGVGTPSFSWKNSGSRQRLQEPAGRLRGQVPLLGGCCGHLTPSGSASGSGTSLVCPSEASWLPRGTVLSLDPSADPPVTDLRWVFSAPVPTPCLIPDTEASSVFSGPFMMRAFFFEDSQVLFFSYYLDFQENSSPLPGF